MKKFGIVCLVLALAMLSSFAYAKSTVTVFWAEYDGVTQEYTNALQDAFNKANTDVEVKIVSINWDALHDKLIASLGGGQAPDLSVIGTRWILEFMDMDVIEPIEQHLSKALIENIPPAIMEGKINNTLYGLPMAIGPRLIFYRTDLMDKAPETYEEALAMAKKYQSADVYGIGLVGKKHTELTDFVYYLYGNGGDFFATEADGSYGKCIINNEAGVQALEFINKLANEEKVTQPSFLADIRADVQDLMVSGKLGLMQSGGFTGAMLKQRDVQFGWAPAPSLHFEGKPRASLYVTDSIVMFKASKDKAAAAKFLEFLFQDEWRLRFDQLAGFPPVTKSLGTNAAFQDPTYQTMIQAMDGAKPWPLVMEWPEISDVIWNAQTSVLLKEKDATTALDEAAAQIDEIRGIK